MELVVKELGVARGGVRVLEGLSFVLGAGQALILRGPNGSGKTTLLRVLAGLQPSVAGRISVSRDSVAYASHADGIKGQLSVAENLHFWARLHAERDITRALEAFDLRALQDRLAGALSAGQKRRLGLARLMVTGRPLWLLDEPTVSLDSEAVALFGAAIEAHLQRGGMAVIATHIDLGLTSARVLDVTPFRARRPVGDAFDEAFL
ncbi:heme ABC exporter ATP-binding protein CcmA [Pseudooceanicola spongiae]|uniref:Heme ABC exporter ATP-binding protein CcmA n=1 Tax=Pseudooceanicola spongiae TaxID=2613965 RepID=A0A7L9WIR5_9RHOB|nr:heme ABC exporter ATP-binding protein CcmA [Pseudooceanicola spongiae]QOL79714.1 heme ABC exporter ATP-binding protein CcmA [Pseudooceanicola spongiae]